jgi:hypothetical protein
MGEWQPPTAADYAWAAADDAKRENASLGERVTALEQRCDFLLRALVAVTAPIDPSVSDLPARRRHGER